MTATPWRWDADAVRPGGLKDGGAVRKGTARRRCLAGTVHLRALKSTAASLQQGRRTYWQAGARAAEQAECLGVSV